LTLTGKSRVQAMGHFGEQWSGNAHLLWDDAVGQSMVSSFEVESDGVYDIAIQLTVAPDYGLSELSLGGTGVKQSIDLYGPKVDLAPLVKLTNIHLKAGAQTITFKLTGSHPKARKFRGTGYLMGLDYVQLVRKDKPQDDEDAVAGTEHARLESNRPAVTPLSFDELTTTIGQYCHRCHGGDSSQQTHSPQP